MRTIVTLAVAAFASTAAIAQSGEQRFSHDGSTYVYTTKPEHGRTVISGRELVSGETFRLVVFGNRVTGVRGGQPVSFSTASAKGAASGVLVAAN